FGIFVFAPDDLTVMRRKQYLTVRDNVIFEAGMFVGRLGRLRTFLIAPEESRRLRLPSDLLGVTLAYYDGAKRINASTLTPACKKIKEAIKDSMPRSGADRLEQVQAGLFPHFTFEHLFKNAKHISL